MARYDTAFGGALPPATQFDTTAGSVPATLQRGDDWLKMLLSVGQRAAGQYTMQESDRLRQNPAAAVQPMSATEPTVAPPKGDVLMTEQKFDDGNGGNVVHVYSESGKPKSFAEFEKAIKEYDDNNGKAPKGFVVLPEGFVQKARSAFDAGRKPVQRAITGMTGTVGTVAALPGAAVAKVGEDVGLLPTGSGSGVLQTGRSGGRAVGEFAGNMLDDPKSTGDALGQILAAYRTKGMTLIPQLLATVAGSISGTAGAGLLTGDKAEPGELATRAMLAAGAKGFQGFVQHLTGTSVSQQAGEQVARKMADYIKQRYKSVLPEDNILEMVASSKADFPRLIQMLADAPQGDLAVAGRRLSTAASEVLPTGTIAAGTRHSLTAQFAKLARAGDDLLKAAGDVDVDNKLATAFQSIRADIINLIKNDKSKFMSTADKDVAIRAVLNEYTAQLNKLGEVSKVIRIAKEAGMDGGWNLPKFQQLIKDTYLAQPGSLLGDVGTAAGRGSLLTSATDRGIRPTEVILGNTLRFSSLNPTMQKVLQAAIGVGPRMGTRYAGTVRGTGGGTLSAATAVSNQAIQKFLAE